LIGALATLGFSFYVFGIQGGLADYLLNTAPVITTAISPFVVGWFLAKYVGTSSYAQGTFLIGMFTLVCGSTFLYYNAFFVHLDALNGLLFLFLPPWQVAFIIVVFIICKIMDNKQDRQSES